MPKRVVKLPAQSTDLELFRLAAEHAPIHIIFTDTDGVIRYANPAAEKITGYSRLEMLGRRPNLWGGLMPKAFYADLWRTVKERRQVFRGEIRNRRKDGSEYIADATITPVIEGRRLLGFIGLERDVTNERKLFLGMTASSERYQLAMSAIRGVVWEWDLKTDRLVFSEGIHTLFGYPDSVRYTTIAWWRARVHPDDRDQFDRSLERAKQLKQPSWQREYRFRLSNRSYVYVRDYAIIVYEGKRAVRMVGAFQDISAQRQLAEEKEQLTANMSLILSSTREGIISVDTKNRCQFANAAAAEMLGFRVSEMQGKNMHALVHHSYPDGSPYPEASCVISRAATRHGSASAFQNRELFWRKDGTKLPVAYTAAPMLQNGKKLGNLVTFVDITDQVRLEEKTHELETLKNRFIQVVSHQFRTPLNAIRWNLEALADEHLGSLTETQKEFARLIRDMDVEVIDRIGDLLTAIEIEEGRVRLQREPVALDELLQSVVGEIRPQCDSRGVRCVYSPVTKSFPFVQADPEKLRAAMQKLIENAVMYTQKNGTISIRLKRKDTHARFEVSDTGIGIPRAEQGRIFSRFFRASNASSMKPDASGLGLFIAKQFIEAHGGTIGFRSTEGSGSTFWFDLPLARGR